MRIAIESTEEIIVLDGFPTRAWRGMTDGGVSVIVMVHRIVVPDPDQTEAFERELGTFTVFPPETAESYVPLSAICPYPEWN
jgi:hypothetical protein